MRKTKIVATLGPATLREGVLENLLKAGVDVVRLNFSHGSREEHGRHLKAIRELEKVVGPVAVLVDTRGPEVRLRGIEGERLLLSEGEEVLLTGRDVLGTRERLSINYPSISESLQSGDRVLLADGLVELVVLAVEEDILCKVMNTGEIQSHKGVNIPGVSLHLPSLTREDHEDILFGIEMNVDYVAASFIRRPQDIIEMRRVIEEAGGDQHIIAKIENEEGVRNVEDILDLADGLMVARGDLGVEIAPEKIPALQKSMIRLCNSAGKPVITATQMLESMIQNPRPTRAEASDVANAIYDGTDATMLSGETAIGAYPVRAVKTMALIAIETENSLSYEELLNHKRFSPQCTITDSISYSTCDTAHDLDASAIITATRSGFTTRMVSKYRPRSLIIAATPMERVLKRLILSWGVYPILVHPTKSTDTMIESSVEAALKNKLIKEGDLVVITAGSPVGVPGTTNLLKVHIAGQVVIRGTGIGGEAVTGKVHIIKEQHFEDLKEGEILITPSISEKFDPSLKRALAIITETGGLTSHAALIGIELGIPVVVGARGATTTLKNGALITVDSTRGLIYNGWVKVL